MIRMIYIDTASDVKIWGLTGKERLLRMLSQFRDVVIVDDPDQIGDDARALILRDDYLFDPRILSDLVNGENDYAVRYPHSDNIAAVLCQGKNSRRYLEALEKNNIALIENELDLVIPQEMDILYYEKLKKNDPPYLYKVTDKNRRQSEKRLFAEVYKNVTDLVTLWVWPLPAYWMTRFCVRAKLSPNQLTLFGLVLVIIAGFAFWHGHFATGLAAGWLMTFLDTVDGKLARVTVTSSHKGHLLDHGIDLIHPPLWYLAWGMGLNQPLIHGFEVSMILWWMFAGYLGGRLFELVFRAWLAPFSMFVWRPFDSVNRLVTARRNPCLILLTLAWLAGAPGAGLLAVALWHVISTVILGIRLLQAGLVKVRQGHLQTWLNEVDAVSDRSRLLVRMFTRLPETE